MEYKIINFDSYTLRAEEYPKEQKFLIVKLLFPDMESVSAQADRLYKVCIFHNNIKIGELPWIHSGLDDGMDILSIINTKNELQNFILKRSLERLFTGNIIFEI